jgi:hypothetical protein
MNNSGLEQSDAASSARTDFFQKTTPHLPLSVTGRAESPCWVAQVDCGPLSSMVFPFEILQQNYTIVEEKSYKLTKALIKVVCVP